MVLEDESRDTKAWDQQYLHTIQFIGAGVAMVAVVGVT